MEGRADPTTVHNVTVTVRPDKTITYNRHCVHARRGDTITWEIDGGRAFAVIVKAFESPLDEGFKVSERGEAISMTVLPDAKPGFYPYSLCIVDGHGLLVDDPEIIIPTPKGGRGF